MGTGVASDGSVCWTTQSLDDATLSLRAFDCASGRALFERRLARDGGGRHPEIVTGWVPRRGLFIASGHHATLVGPTGRELWSRPAALDTLVVPEGLRTSSYPIALDGFAAIERVSAATGSSLGIERADGGEVRADEGEIALVAGSTTTDRGGGTAGALSHFTFVRASTGSHADVAGQPVLSLPGDAWPLGEHVATEGAFLVVTETREGRADCLHVVRAP